MQMDDTTEKEIKTNDGKLWRDVISNELLIMFNNFTDTM